jgi:hypothetical protein
VIAAVAAGATALVTRAVTRRTHQASAARAAGLDPAEDLSHLPRELQHTALWCLSDGGFERRVVHGVVSHEVDIEVTAFDLETLRERRGEWAYLPVDRPFRIAGVVSVVACRVPRAFPHVLLKCEGAGDDLADDSHLERLTHVAKSVRDGLRLARSYPSELPPTLPETGSPNVPATWRAYTRANDLLDELLGRGLRDSLVATARRDLVIELLGALVLVYPAGRDAAGADALADLTTTALAVADAVLAASPSADRL